MDGIPFGSVAVQGLKPISGYGLDPARGFLPAQDPPAALPASYAAWDRLAARMPWLLLAGRFRTEAATLPPLDPAPLSGDEAERAFMLLAAFASAWVWGETPVAATLPAPIAVPFARLAAALDRPAIASHATVVLHNWRRPDPDRPLGLDNVDTAYDFLGGPDEKWFFLGTLGVEIAGAPLLRSLHAAASLSAGPAPTDGRFADVLVQVEADLRHVADALDDIRRWCDPHVFYRRVRPFLTSWPAPGLIFEGTDLPPQQLPGGSAAQSSLLQAVDAVLGIRHPHPTTSAFLGAMRRFMPVEHRRLLADLQRVSRVRDLAGAAEAGGALATAYDACIKAMSELRRRHLALATDYITREARTAAPVGTGGTDFNVLLRQSRRETRDALLVTSKGET